VSVPAIALEGLTKHYGPVVALQDLTVLDTIGLVGTALGYWQFARRDL
jgi:hypothetical protein